MDWLDLLAVQGTLRSLVQYHSSKASILRCSAFFIVQLSHPYMTTEKTIAYYMPAIIMGPRDKAMSKTGKKKSLFTFSWWNPDNQREREVPHTARPTVLRTMGRIEVRRREKYQGSELGL